MAADEGDNSLTRGATQEVSSSNLPDKLFTDLADIIESRKQVMFRQANSGAVLMFWEVGTRINEEILRNERAEYGKQIVVTVSRQLEEE